MRFVFANHTMKWWRISIRNNNDTEKKQRNKTTTTTTIGTTQTHNFIDRTYIICLCAHAQVKRWQLWLPVLCFFFLRTSHMIVYRVFRCIFFFTRTRTTVFIDRFHGLRDFRRHFPFILHYSYVAHRASNVCVRVCEKCIWNKWINENACKNTGTHTHTCHSGTESE